MVKSPVAVFLLFFLSLPPATALPQFFIRYKFVKDKSYAYSVKVDVDHKMNQYGSERRSRQLLRFLVSLKTLEVLPNGDARLLFKVVSGNWQVDGVPRDAQFGSEIRFLVNPFGQVKECDFKGYQKELFLFQTPPMPQTIHSSWKVRKEIPLPGLSQPYRFESVARVQNYIKAESDETVLMGADFKGVFQGGVPYTSFLRGKSNIEFDLGRGFIRRSGLNLEIKSRVADGKGPLLWHVYRINVQVKIN